MNSTLSNIANTTNDSAIMNSSFSAEMNNISYIFWWHWFHIVEEINTTFAIFPQSLSSLSHYLG